MNHHVVVHAVHIITTGTDKFFLFLCQYSVMFVRDEECDLSFIDGIRIPPLFLNVDGSLGTAIGTNSFRVNLKSESFSVRLMN